ncbi:ribosome biogenesis/translation initiation ATPase RLI, partial [Candidatus Woesearchaeota archaeon ex4484_78]
MPRIAIVRKDLCNPAACGNLCAKLCPVNMRGEDCIVIEEGKKAHIDEVLCIGCGICANRCPFGAIEIINLPEELDKPIHAFGMNGFHLYKLPVPFFGKVTGIVGRNGIGKSTAVKILAGLLKPNLGSDKPVGFDKLVDFFKGSEAQKFFEAVHEGKIKVAYKPQQVELIAKKFKGTVKELLKKVDERGKFDVVVDALDLSVVLDRDISKVSGGELQRVAIAAVVLKDANFYVFDEPSSYLDIKQRIRVARFIRSLVDDDTAVLVVEHDLLVLDYMTDLLYIMYGNSGAYGVVSQPKSARAGLNTYLSGFIREENMRFRDKPVKFSSRPPVKKNEGQELVSWAGVEKKLGDFSLSAREGSVFLNETLGVVGENGIGKTTFVKILAEKIKPDKGEVKGNVKVAYKPQYLVVESDLLVSDFLKDCVKKYENQLVHPLEIERLLLKPLNSLSGGELQRVFIAKCLSQEADLYLLDEPSAYLDIEQRLAFCRVIHEVAEHRKCSILVVDHDLMFIDYLSDRLLVFDGVPAKKGVAKGPFSMEDGM